MVTLDLSFTQAFLREEEWLYFDPFVKNLHERLHNRQVPGSDFTGWLNLPSDILANGLDDILTAGKEIQSECDALVVVGIGGSYLGARAALEWSKPEYYNQLSAEKRGGPEIYFAGNHLSSDGLSDLLNVLQGKRVCLNVISKSGTTTEPAVAFRILRQYLIEQVGEKEAKRRIYVTTGKAKGALHALAVEEGMKAFVVPDDVGGRYSVLTPVGLLPLAAAGVDVLSLVQGAAQMQDSLRSPSVAENAAYRYAAVRNALYRKGKTTEILASYEPALKSFAEWWKQLFGESEGKDQKGIYPSSVAFTTDLHSLGQFIQQGSRNLFETVVRVENAQRDLSLPSETKVDDGLEYLAGKPLSWINEQARLATALAHSDGGVPNILLSVPDRSEKSLGQLFYFFELACAASGLLMGVNPFDQPGVEDYKVNMFALLGKPGYEQEQKDIVARLR
ncbi:glucose-6-phosphate isomerase [Alicyclobacillus tolerans]|uniref:glucose-6-phosphate isomerase n=1 Tax=Alicyclobacillus tolerans TaxID=90970 RepID=UPI001F01ED6B|nr:glucose-6-phosphate isomerase [Alicyclobacillus tolerans]MCF8567226.1 glucose-6-phosphate isomerase [Alicyclobacillus tolerans]